MSSSEVQPAVWLVAEEYWHALAEICDWLHHASRKALSAPIAPAARMTSAAGPCREPSEA